MFEFKSLKDVDDSTIEVMLSGIPRDHITQLEIYFRKTCYKYYYLFEDEFFKSDSEKYLDYILPAVRRVYFEIFIKEKEIFKPETKHNLECLELFRLLFDLEDFLNYLVQKLMKNHDKLDDFENLDSKAEILFLIVQNYVSGLIKKSRISNPIVEIRNLKLEKLKIN